MSQHSPESGVPSNKKRGAAFAVATAMSVLTIVDTTKVNVGLPSIEAALGASTTQLQLLVAGYTLAMGLMLVPAGRLGDRISRRRMMMIGLLMFTLASLGGALAASAELLVAFRIVQGLAAGMLTPQVIGLIQELYQGAERGRIFGIFGASVGLATALGPTIGGLLISLGGEHYGWALLFWMNVPLGAVLLILALRYLPIPDPSALQKGKTDPLGVVLLAGTVFPLMLPFVLTTGSPDDDPWRWLWLLLAAVFGVLLVRWETHITARGGAPLIDFRLFGIPSFRTGVLVGASYFAAMPSFFLIMTLYLQQGISLEPVYAGMVSITFALASAWSSWWSGRRVNQIGRPIVIGGLVLVALGFGSSLLVAQWVPHESVPWWIAGTLLVAGLGGGAVISPNQTLALARVPVHFAGVAGSVVQVGQRVGTSMGTAAVTALFFLTVHRGAGEPQAEVYDRSFLFAGLGVVGLTAIALICALFDLRNRDAGDSIADEL